MRALLGHLGARLPLLSAFTIWLLRVALQTSELLLLPLTCVWRHPPGIGECLKACLIWCLGNFSEVIERIGKFMPVLFMGKITTIIWLREMVARFWWGHWAYPCWEGKFGPGVPRGRASQVRGKSLWRCCLFGKQAEHGSAGKQGNSLLLISPNKSSSELQTASPFHCLEFSHVELKSF